MLACQRKPGSPGFSAFRSPSCSPVPLPSAPGSCLLRAYIQKRQPEPQSTQSILDAKQHGPTVV